MTPVESSDSRAEGGENDHVLEEQPQEDTSIEPQTRRWSNKTTKSPIWMKDYILPKGKTGQACLFPISDYISY